jgi:hypothetical protein
MRETFRALSVNLSVQKRVIARGANGGLAGPPLTGPAALQAPGSTVSRKDTRYVYLNLG